MTGHNRNTEATFWSRTDRSGECWEWTGTRHPKGYGQMRYKGRLWRAPRLAWTFAVGPIADGQHVLHSCDNPPCVRPDHLFLGTNAENVADREAKGRRRPPCGELNPTAKLTEADVLVIRSLPAAVPRRVLAARFGVSVATIKRVTSRRAWLHV